MFKVGLTGGIGSGKSTVADLFARLGVVIIDADEMARAVVAPGSPVLNEVVARFGTEVRNADGTLDRAALRQRIFNDPEQRKQLEAILHPHILERMYAQADAATGPYCLLVLPLLLETNQQNRLDRVLVIDCPEALQRQRAMARDGMSAQAVERIMTAQMSRRQRLLAADDVIVNDGDLQHLETQVRAKHRLFVDLASH